MAALPSAPGTRYFIEKRLRAEARRSAISSSNVAAEEICGALLTRAIEAVRLPKRTDGTAGREMLLNLALLLPCPAVAEFGRLNDALDCRFGEQGISLECQGPWPPFHFCRCLDEVPS